MTRLELFSVISLCLLAFGLASCEPQVAGPVASQVELSGQMVARVIDGDTLTLRNGTTIRYVGIDTPEEGSAGYDLATEKHGALIAGQSVEVDVRGRDRYGRTLAFLSVGELDPASRLLEMGYAWIYQTGPTDLDEVRRERYLQALVTAIDQKRGIWEKIHELQPTGPFSATRFRVHRSHCRHLKRAKPRAVDSILSAIKTGRSPCRTCQPLAPRSRK